MEPVAVGLVGAGPWAVRTHAPVLAAGPHTRLAGVWARRPEAAAGLGAPVYERLEELFDVCEAVAFAVPPAVQAELAVRAARAGKALLLEKPLAADLDGAERVAEAVAETGVPSQMVFSWRYAEGVRAFLTAARDLAPFGAHAAYVSGSLRPESPFATPWRLARGAILDIGPHMIDLVDAALGRVVGVRARGNVLGWAGLMLEHEGGALSEISLCMSAPGERHAAVTVYGENGRATVDHTALSGDAVFPAMAAEFAGTVRERSPHPLDAAHGLRVQRLIAAAEAQLTS
ncbi:Gfo/Idh/MocA family oxidoreductase [Spongiactinospora sp. TRM90649]|uniref:Gfo/Idh/MocA family protein n=1 Tax=Spongiactinospora sp. TRM90649 TaxID=3031114 RepID=UPI0023F7F37F|nr:Gfo/Idh/MocA family oxidoreductase [Spongiactinospora sp. TRM90649]MDF5755713.1 Gfo/Idh/MocA family oxidoreductase [Spongiactinospora sp. TRM90649]